MSVRHEWRRNDRDLARRLCDGGTRNVGNGSNDAAAVS